MRFPFSLRLAGILLCFVLSTIILVYTKDFLLPIIISALLSFLLYPLCRRLEKIKIPRIAAIMISMLIVLLLLVMVLLFISSQVSTLVREMSGMNQKLEFKLNMLHEYIVTHFPISNDTLDQWIENGKVKIIANLGEMLGGTVSTTTEIMSYFGLVPVYVFCFLLYKKSFKDFAFSLIDGEKHREITHLLGSIQKLSQNYLIGLFSVILIIGILNSLGLWIIGINNALFFGFFAALLTIIPYIGIFIGSLLPIAYALLTKDSLGAAAGVVIVFSIVQVLESNYITPRVVGSRVSINPFAAIVALLIGAEIWGAAGMILSIPITAILKLIFDARESTKAIGYFLGSELTDDKDNPAKTLGREQL